MPSYQHIFLFFNPSLLSLSSDGLPIYYSQLVHIVQHEVLYFSFFLLDINPGNDWLQFAILSVVFFISWYNMIFISHISCDIRSIPISQLLSKYCNTYSTNAGCVISFLFFSSFLICLNDFCFLSISKFLPFVYSSVSMVWSFRTCRSYVNGLWKCYILKCHAFTFPLFVMKSVFLNV